MPGPASFEEYRTFKAWLISMKVVPSAGVNATKSSAPVSESQLYVAIPFRSSNAPKGQATYTKPDDSRLPRSEYSLATAEFHADLAMNAVAVAPSSTSRRDSLPFIS